jgi:phage shock protein PspC (stress-responsive transcriptional regulator)
METPPPNDGDQDPTEPVAATPPPPPPPEPRRLMRSRTDRIIGGVGGGLAEHLGLDPLLVRFGLGLLVVVTGGAGLLLYVAAWLLVPDEQLAAGQEPPAPRSRAATIAGVGALVLLVCIALPGGFLVGWFAAPFALLALAGLAVWWLVMGIPADRTGRGVLLGIALGLTVLVVAGLLFAAGAAGVAGGGGVVVAIIVTAAGLTLVLSAFLRPLRWLIVPALALGLGAGTAVAAGVEDVGGSTGEEFYRPATAADIRRDRPARGDRRARPLRPRHGRHRRRPRRRRPGARGHVARGRDGRRRTRRHRDRPRSRRRRLGPRLA